MTAGVDALRGKVARLRERLGKQGAPRHWCLHLASGQEIPAVILAKMRPDDEVMVREYPYMEVDEEDKCSLGYVDTPGGVFIVWPDGTLEKVVKQ